MTTRKIPRSAAVALFVGSFALIVVACSSTNGGNTTGSGGMSTIVGPGPNSSSTGTGSPTGSSSGGGHGGMGTGGGTGGCVMGTPMSNTDFLNACNGLTCTPFDNKGRLPLLNKDGSLPPLP